MVPSKKGDPGLVSDFESEKKKKGFDAIETSINIIPKEKVGNAGGISSDFEEFE